jgi:hypothetical protein
MMCEGTARDYVDLLLKSSADVRDVNFTFFGGEPFMNWKVMRATVLYGEQRAREMGKRIHFAVTTNGTLFDEEKNDFIIEHGIQVTVSMDGPPEVQNRFRILTDGQGSYDLVVAKATPLLKRARVSCRVTLTRKTLDVQRIVDHLLGLGFAEVGIGVVSSPDSLMNLGPEHLPRLLDEFKVCADRFVRAACTGGYYGFSNLTTILHQIHEGAAKSSAAGPGYRCSPVIRSATSTAAIVWWATPSTRSAPSRAASIGTSSTHRSMTFTSSTSSTVRSVGRDTCAAVDVSTSLKSTTTAISGGLTSRSAIGFVSGLLLACALMRRS